MFPVLSIVAAASIVAAPADAITQQARHDLEQRLTQPVTANFEGVDFASAVEFLSEHAGVNIILSEKARALGKPVSVHLVDLPLSHALQLLLRSQGFLYRVDGESVWVATRDEMESEPMETRVWLLNQGPGLTAAFEHHEHLLAFPRAHHRL